MTPDLDHILGELWPQVRRRHLFPELPAPECTEGEERVGLDIKGKRISISRKFVSAMSRVLRPKEVLEGLLDHAVSHYLYCPWDFSSHLRLYGEAKSVLQDKQVAKKATDCFIDVVADTNCVSRMDTPIPNIYRHVNRGPLDEAIHALYQKIWGMDLRVKGCEEIAAKLSRLPYLDRSQWEESIKIFSRVLQNLLKEEEESRETDGSSPMGNHGLNQYSPQEIERGLKDLAKKASAPDEFKELIRDFEDEIQDAFHSNEMDMGLGPGRPLDADILYYMKLAENYGLSIKRKPMEKSGALYPHHHVPWEVGKPFHDIDPWTSFGKIMPGITQTWQRREGEIVGKGEAVPDCILIIDSSGSMVNPKEFLSQAVLGAACAADAYLRSGAMVGVYNFGDVKAGERNILMYTRQRDKIYNALCHYFGGGTRLDVADIEILQQPSKSDIFIISDMKIMNLNLLVDYFNGLENRVTAVHIGESEYTELFRQSTKAQENISVFFVQRSEDIPKIVLGQIGEYFNPLSGI